MKSDICANIFLFSRVNSRIKEKPLIHVYIDCTETGPIIDVSILIIDQTLIPISESQIHFIERSLENTRMASSGSKESGTATESYSKGNEAFVNDDYQGAIDLYSNALGKQSSKNL